MPCFGKNQHGEDGNESEDERDITSRLEDQEQLINNSSGDPEVSEDGLINTASFWTRSGVVATSLSSARMSYVGLSCSLLES